MKPIVFYRVTDTGATFRFFFEDKYVSFSVTALTTRVSSVEFSRNQRERDRTYALNTFRGDPSAWVEL